MTMVFYSAVRQLARSPNQATLFSAFLAHEQHSCGLAAIGPGRFPSMNPTTRKISAVGDCESHCSVRLDDVDAPRSDDAEFWISHQREAAQNGGGKDQGEHAGVDCKETRVGQSFHDLPL